MYTYMKENMKELKSHENDTGSTQVQIAALKQDIDRLNEHFKAFPKDYNSKIGLMKKVGQMKRLLDYLQRKDKALYEQVKERLEIRG